MKEEEIEKREKRMKEEDTKFWDMSHHADRIGAISLHIPKPKGFFKKRCPLCGRILVIGGYVSYRLYSCQCGYEYAKSSGLD